MTKYLLVGGNGSNFDWPPWGTVRDILDKESNEVHYHPLEQLKNASVPQERENLLSDLKNIGKSNIVGYCRGGALALSLRNHAYTDSVIAIDPTGYKKGENAVKPESVEEDNIYQIYTVENKAPVEDVRIPGSKPYYRLNRAGHYFMSSEENEDLKEIFRNIKAAIEEGESLEKTENAEIKVPS